MQAYAPYRLPKTNQQTTPNACFRDSVPTTSSPWSYATRSLWVKHPYHSISWTYCSSWEVHLPIWGSIWYRLIRHYHHIATWCYVCFHFLLVDSHQPSYTISKHHEPSFNSNFHHSPSLVTIISTIIDHHQASCASLVTICYHQSYHSWSFTIISHQRWRHHRSASWPSRASWAPRRYSDDVPCRRAATGPRLPGEGKSMAQNP